MAEIKIELKDLPDGGMFINVSASDLATTETLKSNTAIQNIAILLVDVLKKSGIDKDQLPNLNRM